MPQFTKDTPTSFENRSVEEARELGRKGGIESGKTRKKQKTLREHFEMFGQSKPNKVVIEQFEKLGIPVSEDDTMLTCMFKWAGVKSVAKGTKMGDLLKFFEVFGKYTGQEPAQKHELTGADGQPLETVRYITPKEYKEVQDHIDQFIGDTDDD